MSLVGKRALVTGASQGIGRGCALALAAAGADVALNDLEPSAEGRALVEEIGALGRQAIFVPGNAFERPGCEQIVAEAIAGLGQIDLLVSNPAFSRRGDFLDYDATLFERTLQGTLLGGFHVCQLVARHLVARASGGKIVLISSVHAEIP
jgi:glucose 1-dehydrogenase